MLTIIELSDDGKTIVNMTVLKNIFSIESHKDHVSINMDNGKIYEYDMCFGLLDLHTVQAAMKDFNIAIVICGDQYYMDNMVGWTNTGFVIRAKKVMLGCKDTE